MRFSEASMRRTLGLDKSIKSALKLELVPSRRLGLLVKKLLPFCEGLRTIGWDPGATPMAGSLLLLRP